jgi:maltose-binding protein MalE
MHKRAMGAVAVTGIAVLLMSACGGASVPAAKPSTKTAAAPASVTSGPPVRDAAADLVIWADNDRVPVIQRYADAFGKENGIKVVVHVATDVQTNSSRTPPRWARAPTSSSVLTTGWVSLSRTTLWRRSTSQLL